MALICATNQQKLSVRRRVRDYPCPGLRIARTRYYPLRRQPTSSLFLFNTFICIERHWTLPSLAVLSARIDQGHGIQHATAPDFGRKNDVSSLEKMKKKIKSAHSTQCRRGKGAALVQTGHVTDIFTRKHTAGKVTKGDASIEGAVFQPLDPNERDMGRRRGHRKFRLSTEGASNPPLKPSPNALEFLRRAKTLLNVCTSLISAALAALQRPSGSSVATATYLVDIIAAGA